MRVTVFPKLVVLSSLIVVMLLSPISVARALIPTSDGGNAMAIFADTKYVVEDPSWRLEEKWELLLIKTDSSGNMQWRQIFGDTYPFASGRPYTVVQTGDGGYAIGGTTSWNEWWLIKTDSSGRMQWNKTYTFSENGGLSGTFGSTYSMILTMDSGFALAGSATIISSGGTSDFCLMKVDSGGNVQWEKTYDGGTQDSSGSMVNTEDEAYSVVQTSDGGYALGGQSRSSGAADFWLVKTDSSGNRVWSTKYWEPYLAAGNHFLEVTHKLVQTSDGGYALAGSEEKSIDDNDFYLTKVDSSGNVQWRNTYGGKYVDVPTSVMQLGDGGFAIGGTMTEVGTTGPISKDLAIVRTDSLGHTLWTKTYNAKINDTSNTKSEEFGYSMCLNNDGAYVIAGTTENAWDGSHVDILLVKTETLETITPVETSLSIGAVTGQLSLQAPGKDSWTPAAEGTAIIGGTKIKTAEAESASFTLAETTTLEMNPNTLVEIQSSTLSSQKLQLLQGEFTATVRNLPDGGTVQVEMSQAVATVKGTIFTISDTNSESKLTVQEGTVTFTSKATGASVDVTAGQSMTATASGLSDAGQQGFPFLATVAIFVVCAGLATGIAVWTFKRKKTKP